MTHIFDEKTKIINEDGTEISTEYPLPVNIVGDNGSSTGTIDALAETVIIQFAGYPLW